MYSKFTLPIYFTLSLDSDTHLKFYGIYLNFYVTVFSSALVMRLLISIIIFISDIYFFRQKVRDKR